MRTTTLIRCLGALVVFSCARPAAALVINVSAPTFNRDWWDFFGIPVAGTASENALLDLTVAAADYWESRIHDPVSIDVEVGFSNRVRTPASGAAVPYVLTDTGTGLIGLHPRVGFFVDPTPFDTSEFATETHTFRDLGTGSLNTGFHFSGGAGAASALDLFTILLHEISHAIVLQITREIAGGLPFAGTVFPTTGSHLDLPETLMNPNAGLAPPFLGQRALPSDLDILATATWGGFTDVTLNGFAVGVDEPRGLASLLAGFGLLLLVRRGRISSPQ
jgi:hypothetical protein